MIDGGGVRIGGYGRTLLDALETPVIALGGSEDRPQRIAQGIEWNNVGGRDGRHGRVCVSEEGSGCW